MEKYFDPREPGSYSGAATFNRYAYLKKGDLIDFLSKQETYSLHKPVRKKFQTSKIIVGGIDHTWQADLVDVSAIANENKGIKFLLTVIDCFSKFAWVKPLKSKDGLSVTKAFNEILKIRSPKKLHTDKGTEFYNKDFKKLLDLKKIKLYSTFSDKKACIVERFNRTLKEKMWRKFTHQDNHKFIDFLQDLVDSYNKTYHRSIKTSPVKVNESNENQIWKNLYGFSKNDGAEEQISFLFHKDDLVRITKEKFVFSKGYTPNWTSEKFVVVKCRPSIPPKYFLEDLEGNSIDGSFYEQELQKVSEEQIEGTYRYIPIEQKFNNKGKLIAIKVHWLGYPNSEDSWIKPNQRV